MEEQSWMNESSGRAGERSGWRAWGRIGLKQVAVSIDDSFPAFIIFASSNNRLQFTLQYNQRPENNHRQISLRNRTLLRDHCPSRRALPSIRSAGCQTSPVRLGPTDSKGARPKQLFDLSEQRSLYPTSNRWKNIFIFKSMDLEWLLPEQIEQILRFCELSALEDLTVAANILETNHWDLEKAMHDVVTNNDQITKNEEQKKLRPNPSPAPEQEPQQWPNLHPFSQEESFEMGPEDYHQLEAQTPPPQPVVASPSEHATLLAQQNYEYEQMQRKMLEKQEEEELLESYQREREAEFSEGQKQFENRKVDEPLALKFRLAHKVAQFTFSRKDKVETVFKYVSCCLREGFENRYSGFDLTQSFPALSLEEKRGETLEQVFEGSSGELLIVREK